MYIFVCVCKAAAAIEASIDGTNKLNFTDYHRFIAKFYIQWFVKFLFEKSELRSCKHLVLSKLDTFLTEFFSQLKDDKTTKTFSMTPSVPMASQSARRVTSRHPKAQPSQVDKRTMPGLKRKAVRPLTPDSMHQRRPSSGLHCFVFFNRLLGVAMFVSCMLTTFAIIMNVLV